MKTAMKNTAQYRRARTTTRPRCQRFTFKAVRDTEGEILYYLILPYLMIGNNAVEGFYRENYHLTLKTSGEIGICNTCAVGNPADECRWTLSGAITGMTVTNCGEAATLGIDLDDECVAGVTAYGTDVWHVMPICLNVETEYQRTDYTCGAASSLMAVNYLLGKSVLEETAISEADYISEFERLSQKEYDASPVRNQTTINNYLGSSVYSYINTTLNTTAFYSLLSSSLYQGYPAVVNMRSNTQYKSITGYTNSGGHYVLVKGIYYDPTTNAYKAVINDPHFMYEGVGGRDMILTDSVWYALYALRYHHILYKM